MFTKKLFICAAMLLVAFFFSIAQAKRVAIISIGPSTLGASASAYSVPIDLNQVDIDGYFSVAVTTAGAGSVLKIEYLVCPTRNGTYATPSTAADIVTAHSPGTDVYSFEPVLSRYMKIKFTETAGNAITALTVHLQLQ